MNGETMPRDVKLWRDSSDRLVCSCDGIDAAGYSETCREISSEFGLKPVGESIDGIDVSYQGYVRGRAQVDLEWDIWMGFMAVAKTVDTEPLILAIAEWLSRNLAEPPNSR
ncbi:hypothetical protein GC170_00635 [bacterium]|nr:hypothetical protein [bacterium]